MAPLDILGWAGVVMLMPVGLFQIWTNWRRKSTEGLSRIAFILLFLGTLALAVGAWLGGASFPVRAIFFRHNRFRGWSFPNVVV